LAALNGNKETFCFLSGERTEAQHYVRRNNGDTILHAAIAGEYFSKCHTIFATLISSFLTNNKNEMFCN